MADRIVTRTLVAAFLTGVLVVSASVAATAGPSAPGGGQLEDLIDLPEGFQPEGIAIDRRGIAYFGSLADGDIYAADLRTGAEVLTIEGPGSAVRGPEGRPARPPLRVRGAVGHRPRDRRRERRASGELPADDRSGVHQRCRADTRRRLVHEQPGRTAVLPAGGPVRRAARSGRHRDVGSCRATGSSSPGSMPTASPRRPTRRRCW